MGARRGRVRCGPELSPRRMHKQDHGSPPPRPPFHVATLLHSLPTDRRFFVFLPFSLYCNFANDQRDPFPRSIESGCNSSGSRPGLVLTTQHHRCGVWDPPTHP